MVNLNMYLEAHPLQIKLWLKIHQNKAKLLYRYYIDMYRALNQHSTHGSGHRLLDRPLANNVVKLFSLRLF